MPSIGSPATTSAAALTRDALPGCGPRYRRRHPEETPLHALVRAHAAAFFARAEADGARLPGFVRAEFDATLACGRPEHGIVRLRCTSCGHDEILAFSCKRRGLCAAGRGGGKPLCAEIAGFMLYGATRCRAVPPRRLSAARPGSRRAKPFFFLCQLRRSV